MITNNLTAEQAILSARQFLTQPGRLSGWLDITSSDLTLRKLDLVEGVMVEDGYYFEVSNDSVTNIMVDSQEVAAWNITFAVRRFSGRITVQVFGTGNGATPVVHTLHSGITPSFLYAKAAR